MPVGGFDPGRLRSENGQLLAQLAAQHRHLLMWQRGYQELAAKLDAVRALCEDAMKLPTAEDPRPASDFVSPRAVLKAMGEWP